MEPLCMLDMSAVSLTKTPTRPQNTAAVFLGNDTECKSKAKQIANNITDNLVDRLVNKLPEVNEYFTVHKKIGEGTFSNVFVATSKVLREKKKFAIKHLTPTSHPSRIIQELKCLKDIGGKDNVVGLELCLRNKDSVAFVMPYFPHDPFSTYVTKMTPKETQLYMKNLLIALQRVHSFNIIHRDVKPSNFLYNRKERRFLLVDFGLSHQVDNTLRKISSACTSRNQNDRKRVIDPFERDNCPIEVKRPVLHSLSSNVPEKPTDRSGLKHSQKKKSPLFKENSPVSKNISISRNINQVKRNLQFGNITAEVKKDVMPVISKNLNTSLSTESSNNFSFGSSFYRIQNSQIKSHFSPNAASPLFRKPTVKVSTLVGACGCDTKPKICNTCIIRTPMHAPRAGTPGYRSPEVLLKYQHQTTAVDIWSAGVIMVSILSGSYPFFRAPDDITALMEMITVFGIDDIRSTATKLGRILLCNETRKPLDLGKLCERLRKRSNEVTEDNSDQSICKTCYQKIIPDEGCLCKDSHNDGTKVHSDQIFPNEAYDLLSKLLCVDPHRRCTAKDALEHPFFKIDF